MKKTIREYDIKGKKVLIRVDFNVPMEEGKITDDNRIRESLPTIQYAIEKGAKVILLSHLGRVKTREDLEKNSLYPIFERLEELLKQKVVFVPETRGIHLEECISKMKEGDVLLVENTRFEDVEGKKESTNDPQLGAYWASLGDIYINDAFGTSHRSHASNVGIASHLPSGIGFLIEKELKAFEPILKDPERPFAVILGGSKVNDKIGVIQNIAPQADYVLIGGGMAYTFLKAQGLEVGSSLVDTENISFCKNMTSKYQGKIILPIDSVNMENDEKIRTCFVSDIKKEEKGLDIGPATLKLFAQYLEACKTVIWNGPVGMFEKHPFEEGTKGICEILKQTSAKVIIGGGDTASAVIDLGYKDTFAHISTGGGASLELLEGKELPGIEAIDNCE